MPAVYSPRLSIEITEEQQKELRDINLPHGWQKALFTHIIDEVIALHKENGIEALAIIISQVARPREVITSLAAAANYGVKYTKGGDSNG